MPPIAPSTAQQPPELLLPDWPAPPSVKAIVTTRRGGVSVRPYDSFNLGAHVGDAPSSVKKNRHLLLEHVAGEPLWLNQVHGAQVLEVGPVEIERWKKGEVPEADGVCTSLEGSPCVVMTADCLPLLLCNKQGTWVQALHGGWRGLAAGIIAEGVNCYVNAGLGKASDLLAYMGPAIGPEHFEVGQEVLEQFLLAGKGGKGKVESEKVREAFVPSPEKPDHYFCNLYRLTQQQLNSCGVEGVYGGNYCCYGEIERFFSFRRDGKQTGRMASLIWLEF